MNRARAMWTLLEPIHVVTYFAPEARAAADALGMRGFWMGYTAQRSAPLGAVGREHRHGRVLRLPPRPPRPGAARRLAPDDARGGARRALGGCGCGAAAAVGRPRRRRARHGRGRGAGLAGRYGRRLRGPGAGRGQPGAAPAREPHLALWQAATTLREHRGDGHIAVLVARGVAPVASHLIKAAAGESDPEVLRTGRKFAEPAWAEGAAALRADGVLTADGQLTEAGRRLHAEIEDATDAAAAGPWHALGDAATTRLADLLAPLAAAVLDSGTLPQPNPVGFVRA